MLINNFKWALGWCLTYGVILAVLAALAYLLGAWHGPDAPFSLVQLLTTYALTVWFGAFVLALLRPIAKKKVGGALIGALFGVVLAIAFHVARNGFVAPDPESLTLIVLLPVSGLVIGVMVATKAQQLFPDPRESKRP